MRKLVHCLLFVGLVAVFNPLKVAAQQQTILFASGQKTLSVSGKKQLDALVAQALPYYEVAGYTDSDGSEEQNLLLSQQRAAVVSDYLKGKGVASSAISLAYFGESQSINDNLNPQIKQQNRRVTVVGYPKIIQNLSEIAPPAQIFSFSPNQEIKFTEKNDIAVEIPADAFKTTSDAPINISFKNYSSKLEMILGSLSTTATDGGLLESAGMFALTALQDGKPLELQQPITYTFPKRNDSTDLDENGFGLYVGILTKGADGSEVVTWEPLNVARTPVAEIPNDCAFNNCFQYKDDDNQPDYEKPYLQPYLRYSPGYLFATNSGEVTLTFKQGQSVKKGENYPNYGELKDEVEEIISECFRNNRFPTSFYAIEQLTSVDFEVNARGEVLNLQNTFPNSEMDAVWQQVFKNRKMAIVANLAEGNTVLVNVLFLPKNVCCRRVYIEHLGKTKATADEIKVVESIKNGNNSLKNRNIPKYVPPYRVKDSLDAPLNSAAYQNSSRKSSDVPEAKGRSFSLPQIGMINCDRRIVIPTQMCLNYKVKCAFSDKVSIVFKKRNAVVRAYQTPETNGFAEVKNAPIGEPILLIAIREENDKAYIAVSDTKISAIPFTNLHFELLTPEKMVWVEQQLK